VLFSLVYLLIGCVKNNTMKNKILLGTILLFQIGNGYSQNFQYLNYNNVKARVTTDGIFFNDKSAGSADYQVPSNQNNSLIYTSTFWFGGLDSDQDLHLSAQKYGTNQDLFSGPIATDYTTTDYNDKYFEKIWTIQATDINTHLQNYNSLNYVVPSEIENWPAHGNIANGEGSNLAPFVDVNHNGIYDPINGDYPNIRGDIAMYLIFNDGAGIHTESGGEALEMEFHFMFYAYATNDYINNTTFINLKVINRSSNVYTNFKVGQFTDGDLGNYTDDYFGCDSVKNMIYTYNGDGDDDGGFGIAPPAIGFKMLNKSMDIAGYFHSDSLGTQNDPDVSTDYWGYMNAEWKSSGIPFTEGGTGYGGTVNTNYLMSSNPNDINGWSEQTELSPPGDRRMFMTSEGTNMLPNDELCYDYAVIYARGNSNLNSVDSLYQIADQIQNFYNDQTSNTCESVVLSTSKVKGYSQIKLFPNPSDGLFNLEGLTVDSEVYLYTMDGKLLKVIGYNSESNFQFDISGFKSGTYLLKIVNKEVVILKKISIK
jgi:hypothetical protein